MKKTKKKSVSTEMAIGAGVAALAAAAAGTFFLYGSKNAKKNRKIVKSWALKARGEVLEKLEGLSDISEDVYHKVVKEVSDKYGKLKTVEDSEVKDFVAELKSHWKDIKKEIVGGSKKGTKKTK